MTINTENNGISITFIIYEGERPENIYEQFTSIIERNSQ